MLYTSFFLICLFGGLHAGGCGDSSSSSSSSGGKYVRLEGWHAVDAGRTLDQRVNVSGTAKDAKDCLQRCTFQNPKCYVVSFNYDTQACTGFTRKAQPGFARDIDAVVLAKTYKKMSPNVGLVFKDYGVPSGVTSMQLPNVGNEDTCKVICQLQPTCNYAVFALADYFCWTANLPALGAQHSQALLDQHKWTSFHAQ